MDTTRPWGVTVHVSTCISRFYSLGTAELIVLKFVTGVEFDRICGFDKAMGRECTCAIAHSTSWLEEEWGLGLNRVIQG